MKPELSYSGQEVYTHDRDRFWLCLLVPEIHREAFFALFALNLELARVPIQVSEEMIGHIRYAWWQESVEEIYSGAKVKGQPVLLALEKERLPKETVVPLVEAYRLAYPDAPTSAEDCLRNAYKQLLQLYCPDNEMKWKKAEALIKWHRERFGNKSNLWLLIKFMMFTL